MTVSDLVWLSEIFNDTNHRAVSLRQLSFLLRPDVHCTDWDQFNVDVCGFLSAIQSGISPISKHVHRQSRFILFMISRARFNWFMHKSTQSERSVVIDAVINKRISLLLQTGKQFKFTQICMSKVQEAKLLQKNRARSILLKCRSR